MSTFGYHKELGKYEEVDEDELLATLTSEEIQELESELANIDPDDNIPIGMRQKDQTAKTPTGNFDREALLRYWEDETLKLLEDDNSELNPGKGSLEEQPDEREEEHETESRVTRSEDKRRNIVEKNKYLNKRESKDAGGLTEKGVNEDEKKDKCKKEPLPSSDRHGKNVGSRNSEKGPGKNSLRSETTDHNLNGTSDRPCENPIVIDEALEQILRDDPAMSELNLNNTEDISQETLLRFAEALSANTHVRVFSLANTHADDRVAFAIAKTLRENRSITNLNIESNFVSGRGILALLASLQHNGTLVELRFHNQRHICGGQVEMEMVRLLRDNTTLLKLGYQFDLPGPRMTATSILTRNQDQQRQRRLQQQREKVPPETAVKQQREKVPPETAVKQQKEKVPPETAVKQQKEKVPPETAVKQQKEKVPPETAVKQKRENVPPETSVQQKREKVPPETSVQQKREKVPPETAVKQQKEKVPPETAVKQKRENVPPETSVQQKREKVPSETPVQQKREKVPPETPVKQRADVSVTKSLAQVSGTKPANRSHQKLPASSQKLVCSDQTLNKVAPPAPPAPPPPTVLQCHSEKKTPARKIAEMIKQHEGSNGTKGQSGQKKSKSKKGKNGANEKESADILKDLKNALKPSLQKRKDDPCCPLAPRRSTRDDLMEAIRGSSIRSLKRVTP